MGNRKTYSNDIKLRAVLESMQRDTTIEQARRKFNIARSILDRWRKHFQQNAVGIFDTSRNKPSKKTSNEPTVVQLKQIIGDLEVKNRILKKSLDSWG